MSDVAMAMDPAAPAPAEPNRWSRWSDRLNPILVREVQQAVKGRMFAVAVFVALAITVTIAVAVVGDRGGRGGGRGAFDAGLATLAPLLLFVVPMQAFQSMRLELRSGIVEQLLLSKLYPRRIVLGKLAAAMVQFVLFVAVLAPLLATSYLLRGVDLPTIGLSLGLALLACLTATAFAISSAAQGILPALQGMTNLGVAFVLGMTSFGLVGYAGSGELGRDLGWLIRSSEFGMMVSLLVTGALASVTMSSLVAQSCLAHQFENRSTGFRVFLLVLCGIAAGWVYLFVDPASVGDAWRAVAVFLTLLGAGFGLFMVTEQAALSPRVRAHVPANALLALLATPFLPGRHRGLLCLLLQYGLVAFGLLLVSTTGGGLGSLRDEATRFALFIAAYALVYLTIGMALRSRLPSGVLGNNAARILVPILIFLGCIVPLLIDVFTRGGVYDWHPGHALNPFWTIERFAFRDRGDGVLVMLWAVAGALLLAHLPGLLRAVREVQAASAARRARPPVAAAEARADA